MTDTATTPLLPVQQAFYDRMTGDPTLMAMAGVWDYVPENASHPYVVLGEAIETPRNAHGEFGRETVETLHVWSRSRGFSEALTILSRLVELFDHQPLTVDGQDMISVRYEFSQALRDPDPEIRHIPIRFRVTTEQQQQEV